jgi:hypothetical protein
VTVPVQPDAGSLSLETLLKLWEASVDPLYSQTLLQKGDGSGLEVFGQMAAQLARASKAIDVTTQAMFIQPWSGQTEAPAAGAARATVVLSFTRTNRLELPLVLTGNVPVEEQVTDWGDNPGDDGQIVLTGRRYRLDAPLVFPPGEPGPLLANATAEQVGWGGNNPMPGTLTAIDQIAGDFTNTGADVLAAGLLRSIRATGVPDVFVPDHVGQYLVLTGGANAGQIVRATSYQGPQGTDGGTLLVERELAFRGTPAGTLIAGETVQQATTLAEGVYLGGNASYAVVAPRQGTFDGTHVLTGLQSTATFTPVAINADNGLAPETAAADWRMFSWATDWGLTVTNQASPAGGRLGFLDELGRERNVRRGPAESDAQYRDRVSKPADVVSPNALIRAANRVLAPAGLTGCFREAGQEGIPGFYFDHDQFDMNGFKVAGPVNQFIPGELVYQLDPATGQIASGRAVVGYSNPGSPFGRVLSTIDVLQGTFQENLDIVGQVSGAVFTIPLGTFGGGNTGKGLAVGDRYRYIFDYLEMRGFFIESVPRIDFGEFGFGYDVGSHDFFDDTGFFDGFPATAGAFFRTLWLAQDQAKAGGVGHDLVIDSGPCP